MDLKIIAQEIREIIKEKQKELELTFEEDAHKYTMKDLDGKVRELQAHPWLAFLPHRLMRE